MNGIRYIKCKHRILEVDGMCTYITAGCLKLVELDLDNVICTDGIIKVDWTTYAIKRKEINSLSL